MLREDWYEPAAELSSEHVNSLKLVLKRSLNKNQLLILSEIRNNRGKTITATLKDISRKSGVSLSTLKLNAKILKELELIHHAEFQSSGLTDFGRIIVEFLGEHHERLQSDN